MRTIKKLEARERRQTTILAILFLIAVFTMCAIADVKASSPKHKFSGWVKTKEKGKPCYAVLKQKF